MIRLDYDQTVFNAMHNKQQCLVPHCTMRTNYPPACTRHLRSVYGVKLGATTLVDNHNTAYEFQGILATNYFKAGDFILPYIGEIIDNKTLRQRYGTGLATYALRATDDIVIDSVKLRGAAAMINMCRPRDTRRSANQSIQNNCEFKLKRGFYPYITATREIVPGDELFVNYGSNYF